MQTLARSAHRKTPAGQPIPDVFTELKRIGFQPKRGAVTMIAAESGSGKTGLALYWTARARMRTLYFSADSDDRTMMERAGAMVAGSSVTTVRQMLYPEPNEEITAHLAQLDNMRFVFESDPTYDDLLEEVEAYTEAWGDYPEVITLDNVANVSGDQEDEYRSMRDTTRALHRLARITNACIFALHHVKEEGPANEDHPPPKRRIKGKISDFVEMILTLYLDDDTGEVRASPVKNRFGKSDKSGRFYVSLYADFNTAQFYNNRTDREQGIPA